MTLKTNFLKFYMCCYLKILVSIISTLQGVTLTKSLHLMFGSMEKSSSGKLFQRKIIPDECISCRIGYVGPASNCGIVQSCYL